ncbi:hypothetical protein VNO77_06591 [Canavalia gladiata]|uniref:Uncharacterized protein n=1 Tax=Canavalia gladiata TaxID=3824 RepID=A0AAN9M7L6_CANGL
MGLYHVCGFLSSSDECYAFKREYLSRHFSSFSPIGVLLCNGCHHHHPVKKLLYIYEYFNAPRSNLGVTNYLTWNMLMPKVYTVSLTDLTIHEQPRADCKCERELEEDRTNTTFTRKTSESSNYEHALSFSM